MLMGHCRSSRCSTSPEDGPPYSHGKRYDCVIDSGGGNVASSSRMKAHQPLKQPHESYSGRTRIAEIAEIESAATLAESGDAPTKDSHR